LGKEPTSQCVGIFLFSVLAAVQLDNKSMFDTAEVRDEISYRHLTPELDADHSPIAEEPPELALSVSHFSP